jgi:hypothetical protein
VFQVKVVEVTLKVFNRRSGRECLGRKSAVRLLKTLQQGFVMGIEVAERLAQQMEFILNQEAESRIRQGRKLDCPDCACP